MDSVLETVKTWLKTNRPHLANADIHLDTQDGAHDLHFADSPLLPGVQDYHVDENEYHVATVTDNVTVDGGFVIPKVLKLTVKGNEVSKVLESKQLPQRGLDKFSIVFVEAEVQVQCAVCNTTSYAFPSTEDLVFTCSKCNRHFKFDYIAIPMTQEEIDAYHKVKVTSKIHRISFNDLP